MTSRGRKIVVRSQKYDGTPRDEYEATLLDRQGSLVRIVVPRGTLVYGGDKRRIEEATDTSTELYFTDRWYNVWHFDAARAPHWNLWYANVSLPATFDGEVLQWVDLDIDLRQYGDGSIVVLDEDEFEVNRRAMSYPDDVVEQALAARDEMLRLAETGAFPFDRDAHVADGASLLLPDA